MPFRSLKRAAGNAEPGTWDYEPGTRWPGLPGRTNVFGDVVVSPVYGASPAEALAKAGLDQGF